jgi:hypothetical protein
MPANTLSNNKGSAKYFKLKKFEYQKQVGQRAFPVKEPAFVKYNPETKQEEFISDSFGGELVKVSIGEPKVFTSKKTGQDFVSQDVFFELHSVDRDGFLTREVVVVSRNSSLLETLVAKLVKVENFKWVDIRVGQFIPKGQSNYVDYLTVMQNGIKLPSMIGVNNPNYPLPEGAIVLPPKVFLDIKKKTVDPITKKSVSVESKQIDTDWVTQKDEIYDQCLEVLIANVAKYVEANPRPIAPLPEGVSEMPDLEDAINVIMPF